MPVDYLDENSPLTKPEMPPIMPFAGAVGPGVLGVLGDEVDALAAAAAAAAAADVGIGDGFFSGAGELVAVVLLLP